METIYVPGLLRLARLYSLFTGYGLILVGLSILGVLTVGVIGTLAFWISRLVAELVTMAHAKRLGQKLLHVTDPQISVMAKRAGIWLAPDGFALRCFGNAYATYARTLGLPIEAVGTADELDSGKWREALREFAQEWPQVAKRFQILDAEWQEILLQRTS